MNAMTRPTILPHPAMIATAPARRWYVLSVEPNRDRHALRALRRRGFDARCLEIEARTSRRDPTPRVELMFPSYLLVEMADGDGEGWYRIVGEEATKYNFVHDVLRRDGHPVPLPVMVVTELFAMATFEEAEDFSEGGRGLIRMAGPEGHEAPSLPEGTPIKVRADGAFRGLPGKFKARKAHKRVKALLTLFGREVEVELNEDEIEVDEDAA